MKTIVIGAGVSGVHAALSLLERGHDVELWDVGGEDPPPPEPGATFEELKHRLPDPAAYFLGEDLRALVPPAVPELLRYPPSRRFLASAHDPLWNFLTEGFAPYASFATGGLANGWGANALAYDEDDLSGWPVSCAEMDRAYRTAFARIPVAGPVTDDLSPYLAGVYPSQPPVRPSHADDILLKTYGRKSRALHRRGIRVGLARLAVVTDPDREDACDYCDRCLWGCPRGAIYNPAASTLSACAAHRNFRHLRGRYVISLLSRENRISALRYLEIDSGAHRDEPRSAM